jgi:tetratricopeptide (TPR) repeat protein
VLNDEAEAQRHAGFYDKAEPLYLRALTLLQESSSKRALATVLNNLGDFYCDTGNYQRSQSYYKQVQKLIGKAVPANDRLNAALLNGMATVALIQGDVSGALKKLERSLRIREAALGPEHLEVSETLNNLGVAQWRAHQNAKAESTLQRALAIVERQLGPDHPDVAVTLTNLGVLYKTEKRYSEAEELFRRALDINIKAFHAGHRDVEDGLFYLAEVLMDEGRFTEAEPLFKQAVDMRAKRPHQVETEDAVMLEQYGNALRSNGNSTDADAAAARADHTSRIEVPDQTVTSF